MRGVQGGVKPRPPFFCQICCGLTPRHNFIELKSEIILQPVFFVLISSDKVLTLETSALKLFAVASLHYQLVNKTKLSCHSHLIRGFPKNYEIKDPTFKIFVEFKHAKFNTHIEKFKLQN